MSVLINFLIGTCLGSNAAWLAQGCAHESWPLRSHCDSCQRELSLLDEMPIFSYLCLRGRCRYCQAPIPQLLFFTEIWGGLSFLPFSLNLKGLTAAIFTFFFLALALLDIQYEKIDLRLLFVPAAIALFNCKDLTNLFLLFLLLVVLFVFAKHELLGMGDVYCIAVLGLYWQQAVFHLLVLACLFCLCSQLLLKTSRTAFVPYLYLAHLCLCYVLF
jgi:leader peptidase (prepilin peptidase)/N-methyltransferase